MKFKVKFSKRFVSGNLKGITIESELSMANLDSANDYIQFCNEHSEVPVVAFGGSDYTIFGARIVDFPCSSN